MQWASPRDAIQLSQSHLLFAETHLTRKDAQQFGTFETMAVVVVAALSSCRLKFPVEC